MSVLVTGGAGYIGSHTVRSLHEANESVVVIDNLSTGFSAFLPEGVPLFIGDAGDENLVEGVIAQHAVDSIIHLAGSVVVPESMMEVAFIHVSDLAEAHRAALSYLRSGGAPVTLNCGYGRGYSVLEAIEAVRRASGRNFAMSYAARRPGDIMTMVADTSRISATLDWRPRYDDIETIAAHALAWEQKLLCDRSGGVMHAASA